MQVFVDASAYISALNKNDSNYKKAIEISDRLFSQGAEFITSNIVIYEVYTILAAKVDKLLAIKFKSKIDLEGVPVIYVDGQIDSEAWKIFEKERSKNVGFFDCTSFAIMKLYEISAVFSFDSDYHKFCKKEGFAFNTILLG
ncbi:hypothetical protein A3A49_01315 [Candidatus Curtissbacteria bacterium RIFCSPLOWO2_01_FULL_38_11b]|uniref:PIN domain-containing protein n=1 Tax=Candidatus Curtissbacteria bacterium RIFCSPLOWO2_01_FULL_38_11b TaxID=1797725 RepID=A0A1F5H1R4_9BACT|nr:MAG: hypothetical protein A3A49_01315 [Candidatus Curtissbacteria bacterium RIFCSPLOWO2_01_FULL_38_11b]